MAIKCPAQKVEPNESNDFTAAQGLVSWHNCLNCHHNKGHDRGRLTVKCGYADKQNPITIESTAI